MRAQTGTVRRGERLDCVSLVEETLVVDLLQKVPQSFDVAVVVGDIGIVHINPVADTLCHIYPFTGIFHDLRTAGCVVIPDGNLLADVFLVDSQFLLNSDFHGKAMSVPSRAALDLVSGHCLVTAHGVLDGTSHHVVDTGHSVSGGGTLEEYELRASLTDFHAAAESIFLFPLLQDRVCGTYEIQPLVFFECHIFCLFLQLQFKTAKIQYLLTLSKIMNALDIVILVLLVPGMVVGLVKGFLAQAVSLAGLVVGVWASFKFSNVLSAYLAARITVSETVLSVICFAVIFIAILLLTALLTKILTKVVEVAMLGWVNRLLGAALALAVGIIFIGVVISLFEAVNQKFAFVAPEVLDTSLLYGPVRDIAYFIFPYLKQLLLKQ